MRLLSSLKKLVIAIRKHKDTNYSVEKQNKILRSLPEPKDDYERSYFQYICQNRKMGLVFNILSNFAGFFLFIIYYIKIGLNKTSKESVQFEAIFLSNDISKDILPQTLHEEFERIIYNNNFDVLIMTKDDKRFIRNLWRKYPISFYFLYKCMMKISMYSGQIQTHSPSAIITYAEYSFTSSILTTYCNLMNVEHINIMHGEKTFDIIDSFFRFNRCYIWDEFYKNLFIKLRAYNDQFIVEIPPSLNMDLNYNIVPIYDFTYYLTNENDVLLRLIKSHLDILEGLDKTVSIRPHPRYSNITSVSRIFNGFDIEDVSVISIKESLESTNGVISLNSTVLLQGSFNNKTVIIDDLTSVKQYKRLFEIDYIVLSKPHRLLSEILNESSYRL